MPSIDILRSAASLGAVIILILLVRCASRFLSRISRPGAASSALAVRTTLTLDGKRRLHLVAYQGHQALLLTGGPSDLMLGWLPRDEAPGGTDRSERP